VWFTLSYILPLIFSLQENIKYRMESKDKSSSFLMQQCPLTLSPQNIGCRWDCRLLLRDTLCDWIQKRNLNKSQTGTCVAANWIVFYVYIFFVSPDLGEQVSFWLAAGGRAQLGMDPPGNRCSPSLLAALHSPPWQLREKVQTLS
jgi:hypothetical protein